MFYQERRYDGVKAFMIARVSDPSQISALPAQELRLKNYAKELGLDAEMYSFDETAYKEDRQKFQKIVEKIYNNKNFCIVVFDKIDRFTRDSSSEIVRLFKEAVREGRLEMHFPSDGLIYHRDSPAFEASRLGMGMVYGEYYSMAIRDNVKRKIEQKLHDGEYPEKAPLGYTNVRIKDKNEIIIDKMREPFIRRAFELRLSGKSIDEITQELRDMGLTSNTKNPKPVSASSIANLFTNKFYYGVMTFRGKDYPHKYDTYITKNDYDEIRRISQQNYTQKFQKKTHYEFAFKGILKCGVCGCSMSSYYQKGRVYMRCSNAKGKCPNNASEIDVMEQITPAITGLSLNESLAEQILAEINKDHDKAKELKEKRANILRNEYRRLSQRKGMLYDDRLDGRITVDEYDKLAEKTDNRMCEIDAELIGLEQPDESDEMTISNLLNLAKNADELFKSSKPAVKNQILRLLVSNLEIKQKRLSFNLLEPFNIIKKMDSRPIWLPGLGSNQQPRS